MKTSFGLLLIAFLVLVCAPGSASAAGLCDGSNPPPSCYDQTTQTQDVTLSVSTTRGTVSSSPAGISCPSDCSQIAQRERVCDGFGCGDWTDPEFTLTASGGGTGFGPHWTGCDSASGATCDIALPANKSISLTWSDDLNPTVGLSSPPAKVGPTSVFNATASDNVAVTKVDFYVDDVLKLTDTSAPYQYTPDLSAYANGSTHTVKAISEDSSGRRSTAATSGFTVDKSTALSLSAIPAFVTTPPSLVFSSDPDVVARNCSLTTTFGACTSPYAPTLSGDGAYTYTVQVVDDVGNSASASRSFVLDQTPPSLAFTDGPTDGQVIGTRTANFAWTGGDANPAAIECAVDGAVFGACASPTSQTLEGLADGSHSFAVRMTDKAGNSTMRTRSFAVKVEQPIGDPPPPPQDNQPQQTTTTTTTTTDTTRTPHEIGTDLPDALKANPTKLASSLKVRKSLTQVRKLKLSGIPAGATVTLKCKGKGCPKKIGKIAVKGGAADLRKVFKKSKLHSGATITITVTAPGYQPHTFTLKTRKK